MPDSSLLRPPNVFLTVGVIFISGAAFFAFTGKVWVVLVAGSPRKTTESILGGGRRVFYRWCFFGRILLVQGDLNPLPLKNGDSAARQSSAETVTIEFRALPQNPG